MISRVGYSGRRRLRGLRSPHLFIWLSPLLLVFSFLSGCGREQEAAPEESGPGVVHVVRAEKLALGGWTEFPGTTQPLPNHAARVAPAIEGRVQSVLPKYDGIQPTEGDRIQAGQVIVQLDDTFAKANLDSARQSLKDLEAQVAAAQLKVETTERLQTQQVDVGTQPLRLTSSVTLREAQLALQAAQAKLASGKKSVEAQQVQLRYYSLRAPISGLLGTIQVVPGQTLAVGSTVADIIDLDEIDVLSLVPPSQIGRVALNQSAEIVPAPGAPAETQPGQQGKVVFIGVQAQSQTGSFPVKVRFANRDLRLRANALVGVRIQTAPVGERLVVPEAVLQEDQEPPGVVVVEDVQTEEKEGNKERVGKARLLEAVTGVRSRERHLVEIIRLKDPENKTNAPPVAESLFVIKGGHGLEDGDPVKIETEQHTEEK
jgi:membrane fusion protein, multidrug efflux system